MATPGGIQTTGSIGYRDALSEKYDRRIWRYGKMSKFMSLIDYKKYIEGGQLGAIKGSLPMESSFIHVYRDLEKKGGIKMDIPVLGPIGGQGFDGAQVAKGHGVQRPIFNKTTRLNMKRQALKVQDNEMSPQMLDPKLRAEMFQKNGNDIKDWFTRYTAFDPMFAALMGFCPHLTNSTYGVNVSQKSHPNTFVKGYNTMDFGTSSGGHVAYTFDAGWETLVAAAIASLIAGGGQEFNVQSIRDIVFLARVKCNIQPLISKDGAELYPIWVTSSHIRQLRQDPEWIQIMESAAERGAKNPLFTGLSEAYSLEGALLIVDDTMPAGRYSGDTDVSVFGQAYSATRGTVNYGRSDYIDYPMDISPRKPALLVGQGAISASNVGGFKLTEEIDDHEQFYENAGRMIYGYERGDIIDLDGYVRGAGLLLENTSSLTYWTWTPTIITI